MGIKVGVGRKRERGERGCAREERGEAIESEGRGEGSEEGGGSLAMAMAAWREKELNGKK